MGDKSKIGWTDATWNPVTGCTKVSAGCKHCYAEALTKRWGQDFSQVMLHPERLAQPLRWRKPRRIFTCSMSDLFHEDIDPKYIAKVFAIFDLARIFRSHTFQVLTKRANVMRKLLTDEDFWFHVGWFESAAQRELGLDCERIDAAFQQQDWMAHRDGLPNVWLGVSVEDQETADERIPLLLETPAARRFVSYEPALGPVDLTPWLPDCICGGNYYGTQVTERHHRACPQAGPLQWPPQTAAIRWLVCGGESGPRARALPLQWLDSAVAQAKLAGVPVYVKQDSHRYPGRQGHIPDDLWALKEAPD